ncbi:MAG: stage III sporulation protein AE [Acetatifactor sp.]
MDLEIIWQEYGLDRLEEGIRTLFPQSSISLEGLLTKVMEGDVLGAMAELFTGSITNFVAQLSGMKNIFIWLLVLGIVSSLMTHFVEIFDRHQVADMGFYFMYLLFSVILLQCFLKAAATAAETLENIILFIRLLMPAYLITVGVSTGSVTAGASCQLMLLVIYGVEYVLEKGIIPLVYSFVMLVVVNGIWVEEKLTLLIDLLEKGIGWALKGALGIITGFSVFQSLVTPVVDSARKAGLQKLVAAIPGVGGAADGVVELVLGSAAVIKNSVGVLLLILLLLLCAAPLVKIAVIAGILKCAAAFMGIVSDRRITSCADRTGDAGLLLFRTVGTAMLLFLISVAVITASGGR